MSPVRICLQPRTPGSRREPLSGAEVAAAAGRVLGASVEVTSAAELPHGSSNTTLRLELADGAAVVLRAAPRRERQLRSERDWLRAEHAAGPWLAVLSTLVPKVLGADFTHQVLDRDYLLVEVAPGVPAPDRMPGYDRGRWPGLFGQLGALSARVHAVTGERWGPLSGPLEDRWSDALHGSLRDSVADLEELGSPSGGAARLADVVDRNRHRLDRLRFPRLLHGDLWTANVMLDPDAAEPRIVGVLDAERAWWGDPLADWALYRADERAVGAESDAFWVGYGGRPSGGEVEWRRLLYRCRHLVAVQVEAGRCEQWDRADAAHGELSGILRSLASPTVSTSTGAVTAASRGV